MNNGNQSTLSSYVIPKPAYSFIEKDKLAVIMEWVWRIHLPRNLCSCCIYSLSKHQLFYQRMRLGQDASKFETQFKFWFHTSSITKITKTKIARITSSENNTTQSHQRCTIRQKCSNTRLQTEMQQHGKNSNTSQRYKRKNE